MTPFTRLFGPRIETRFVSTISLVVAIALVSLVVVVSAEIRDLFAGELTTRVNLALLALEHTYPEAPFSPGAIPEGVHYVAARGPRGEVRVVAPGYGGPVHLPAAPAAPDSALVKVDGGELLLFRRTRARPDGEVSLWVAVGSEGLRRRSWLVSAKIAVVGAAILISCYFLGVFLARTMLDPLDAFNTAMARVAEGQREHVLVPGAPENFGQFQESFNLMVDQIHQNREMERALLARDKMATVGQLAAAVAHETRNPLAAISSLTQLLADEVKEQPRLREYTAVVLKEVARLDDAITQLLEYARPVRGQFRETRLEPLVRDVVTLFGFEARRRGVVLALGEDLPGEGEAPRLADANQVKQLLVNLVQNALAHSPLGGEVRIDLAIDAAGLARLAVTDQGPGVSGEVRARMFEPFYSQRTGGTGLGLAIAHRIVEGHCGRIWVEDGDGEGDRRGARFVVELPALAEAPALPEDAGPAGPSPWPSARRSEPT